MGYYDVDPDLHLSGIGRSAEGTVSSSTAEEHAEEIEKYIYWLVPPCSKVWKSLSDVYAADGLRQMTAALTRLRDRPEVVLYPAPEAVHSQLYPADPMRVRLIVVTGIKKYTEKVIGMRKVHEHRPRMFRTCNSHEVHFITLPLIWMRDRADREDAFVGVDTPLGLLFQGLHNFYLRSNRVVWLTTDDTSDTMLQDLGGVNGMPWIQSDVFREDGMVAVNAARQALELSQWKVTQEKVDRLKQAKKPKKPKAPEYRPIQLEFVAS